MGKRGKPDEDIAIHYPLSAGQQTELCNYFLQQAGMSGGKGASPTSCVPGGVR